MFNKFFKSLRFKLTRKYYAVGIIENSNISELATSRAQNVHWLKYPGYKDNWIADPFIAEVNNQEIILFAEQWMSKKNKGKLVKVTVSRTNFNVINIQTILELETHLSFPAIYQINSEIYVYPENYQSGSLQIYKYNHITNKLESPITLINEPLIDSQLIEISNAYYIFATKYSDTDNLYNELLIYKSKALFGPYKKIQQIRNKEKTERGAGLLIRCKDLIIRPVQDCKKQYGEAVIFKKLNFDGLTFDEEEIGKLIKSLTYPEGLHTYNTLDNITVVDGISYRLGNWISRLKIFLNFTIYKTSK